MTSKRRKWLIVLACLALTITLAVVLTWSDEPRHEGRILSEWMMELSPNSPNTQQSSDADDARAAIRAIGTNAIPHLLTFITSEPENSHARKAVQWLLVKLPDSVRYRFPALSQWAIFGPSDARRLKAPFAFEALGSAASSAIPRLEQLLQTSTNRTIYWITLRSLAAISTNAQPVLLSKLADPDPKERTSAANVYALFAMQQSNAGPAVPLLLRNLEDTNMPLTTRFVAARTLGEIKVSPDLVVPSLAKALTDPNPALCVAATNALLRIAPEVLTNAPPQ